MSKQGFRPGSPVASLLHLHGMIHLRQHTLVDMSGPMASAEEAVSMHTSTDSSRDDPEELASNQSHATDAAKTAKPSTKLRRTTSVLWLWLFYALLSIFAWVITCVLAFQPITTSQYGADTLSQHYSAFRNKDT